MKALAHSYIMSWGYLTLATLMITSHMPFKSCSRTQARAAANAAAAL